jgi:hypothetical protein
MLIVYFSGFNGCIEYVVTNFKIRVLNLFWKKKIKWHKFFKVANWFLIETNKLRIFKNFLMEQIELDEKKIMLFQIWQKKII